MTIKANRPGGGNAGRGDNPHIQLSLNSDRRPEPWVGRTYKLDKPLATKKEKTSTSIGDDGMITIGYKKYKKKPMPGKEK